MKKYLTNVKDSSFTNKRFRNWRMLNEYVYFIIVLTLIVSMELVLLFSNGLFWLNPWGIIVDVLFYASVLFLILLIPHQVTKKTVLTVVITAFAFVFIIDSIYSYFFSGFGSITSFSGVEAATGTEIGVRFTANAIGVTVLYAITIILVWLFKIKKRNDKQRRKSLWGFTIIVTLILGNVISLESIKARQYDTKLEYYGSDTYLYQGFQNSTRFVTRFGYINLRIRDLFFKPSSTALADISEFFEPIPSDYSSDLTGILKDYNIITMMCETLDTRVLSNELTPNMMSVMNKSLVFDNWYTPAFFEGATINSEFMTNTSLIPTAPKSWGSNIAILYNKNSWSSMSLPGQLNDNGYDTYYLHLNTETFYMRNKFIPSLGFTNSYFIDDLPYASNHYDIDLVDLLDYVNFDNKFYVNMLNYSMHSGGDGDYTSNNPKNLNYENYQYVKKMYPNVSKKTQAYFTKTMMFDSYVGGVFDKLDEEGALDNTIVLIFPDHYNYGDNGSFYEELGVDETSKEVEHQKMTMYLPDSAKEKLLSKIEHSNIDGKLTTDIVASTIDITPTVLNLLTSDSNYKYFMGSDFFGAQPKYVYFADNTVFDGEVFFNVTAGAYNYLGLSEEKMLSNCEKLRPELERHIEMSIMSGMMLDLDYFKP